MTTPEDFHYDQGHIFQLFVQFMQELDPAEGVEVTEDDLLTAWREADQRIGYHKAFSEQSN